MEPLPRPQHPIFARCYAALAPLAELAGGQRLRRELLAGLAGRVLEIGGGTGANLRHYPPGVQQVTVVEPEGHLRSGCERAARRAQARVEVLAAFAERLPLPDSSFDAAVSSLVLCSVTDQESALAELMRVIRPGGQLRFYEHVRSPGLVGRLQDAVDAPWGLIAGGCHLNRDTVTAVASAGFVVLEMRAMPTRVAGVPIPGPRMVLGRAIRP
jgi:SAM-dependent methyltransferase